MSNSLENILTRRRAERLTELLGGNTKIPVRIAPTAHHNGKHRHWCKGVLIAVKNKKFLCKGANGIVGEENFEDVRLHLSVCPPKVRNCWRTVLTEIQGEPGNGQAVAEVQSAISPVTETMPTADDALKRLEQPQSVAPKAPAAKPPSEMSMLIDQIRGIDADLQELFDMRQDLEAKVKNILSDQGPSHIMKLQEDRKAGVALIEEIDAQIRFIADRMAALPKIADLPALPESVQHRIKQLNLPHSVGIATSLPVVQQLGRDVTLKDYRLRILDWLTSHDNPWMKTKALMRACKIPDSVSPRKVLGQLKDNEVLEHRGATTAQEVRIAVPK